MRARSLLHPLLSAAITMSGALAVSVVAAAPALAALADLVINEVESNGDATDWIELVNPTPVEIDATGLRLKDNDDTRTFAIAAGTTVPAGGFVAIDVDGDGGFGLGGGDSARLFEADGTTLIDSYTWTEHAATTYGRCPDAAGDFVTTSASTKGAANACPGVSDLRINEVESSGGTPVDWIELVNPTPVEIDATGLRLKDNDDTRTFAIAAGTTVPAGGFVAIDVDGDGGFGLGGGDSARLFEADGTTLIDSYTWTEHAATTYGRCPDATGDFFATVSPTKGAANDCPAGPAVTVTFNEVESNGDPVGDFAELVNTGAEPFDLSGFRFRDNDDTRPFYTIPDETVVAPGDYYVLAEADFDFGLGGGDSVRLYAPTGGLDGDTPVDTYTWTQHAATSYGRCPDGTGEFVTTASTTRGAANDCPGPELPSIAVNEVESNGDAIGDFVELKNTGDASVDISGWIFRDNDDEDPTHAYPIPVGTTVAPDEYYVLATADFGFGLGGGDSARLFLADGTTLVDSYEWTEHAETTYGRCPDGTGGFGTTLSSTRGAANDCPAEAKVTVTFNEVESNGDLVGDFAELVNTGTEGFDLSGYRFKDNDDSKAFYTIPDDTIVAPGDYYVLAEADFGFGLGGADSVRLFGPAGGSAGDEAIDTYTWVTHAATTYGRCPDGTGDFTTTTSSTRGAANDCSAAVRINEVESSGGEPGDWVELVNNGVDPVDVGGFFFKDDDDARTFQIPAATSIAPGAYLVLDEADFGFGLGGADSARLFAADGSTLIDSYTWLTHAATTYGRCPDGTGDFATTRTATKGATNQCVGDLVTEPWPGSQDVATVDEAGVLGGDISGLTYESTGTTTPGTLFAVNNGTGELVRLAKSGDTWSPTATNTLTYPDGTGLPDTEGVTLGAGGSADGVYAATERNNASSGVSRPAILRWDVPAGEATLSATHEWNLVDDLPTVAANSGLEGIAFVPDSYLLEAGLVDETTGAAYDPTTYADHRGGLFLVGLEGNGQVYAYALDHTAGTFTRVADFASGFPAVMDLHFEASTQQLWVVCDDTCEGRIGLVDVTDGAFAPETYYERPAGMPNINNEGFTLAGGSECVEGVKPALWSDDSNTGGFALREGTVTCVEDVDPVVVDPTITADVTSAEPPSATGWYAGPVTVTFTCTPMSAPIVGDCPAPAVLDESGADQVVTGSVTAEDGGTATTSVTVDVDLDAPAVTVGGIKDGRTYRGDEPAGRCVASDATSDVDTCTVESMRNGRSVLVTATATDLAGNTASASKRFRVPLVQVLGARFNGGRYIVRRGDAFQVQAVFGASSKPRLLKPVKQKKQLSGAGRTMRASETQDNVTTWVRKAKVGKRTTGKKWKVGVLVGGTTTVIKLKVRG